MTTIGPRPTTTPTTPRPAATPAPTTPAVQTNTSVSGQVNTPQAPSVSQGSASGSYNASTFQASTTGTGPGGVSTRAHAAGPSLTVDAKAEHDVGLDGIDIKLQVDIDATLAEAGAGASKTVEFEIAGEKYSVDLDLEAMGKIGADGHLNLDIHIGTNGQLSINASANGFAGAQASLTGSVTLKHEGNELASGSITASASAGVSGDAHANLGLEGTTLNWDVGVEATAGVGLGFDISGSVNVGEVLKAVGETAVAAGGDLLKGVAEGAINEAGKVVDAVGETAGNIIEGAGNVAEDIYDNTIGRIF